MGQRSYDHYCGLARALDVVGERWTLLLVRELLLGPKRYGELLEALNGISTNLLAQRLKELEAAAVIHRRTHDGSGRFPVYELTEMGWRLEPSVLGLARWGLQLMSARGPDDTLSPAWTMLAVKALIDPGDTVGVWERYEFDIDGNVFHLELADGRVSVGSGPASGAHSRIEVDTETFVAIGSSQLRPTQALADGSMTVDGDPEAVLRLAKVMDLVT
jgi:DNA-binding HxlR family transcriptional regulator